MSKLQPSLEYGEYGSRYGVPVGPEYGSASTADTTGDFKVREYGYGRLIGDPKRPKYEYESTAFHPSKSPKIMDFLKVRR